MRPSRNEVIVAIGAVVVVALLVLLVVGTRPF